MEKKYVCPVCQKECENLTTLNKCVTQHIEYEKNEQARVKTDQINSLKTENERLVRQIERNCKKLKELGVTAIINYNIIEGRPSLNFRNLDFVKSNNSKEDSKDNKSAQEKINQSDIKNFVRGLLNWTDFLDD